MSLMFVAGTRPEIIKLAPVLWGLKREEYTFVWSGQHYDYEMSRIFFRELEVPEPDVDLGVGSGSHAEQTAKIMVELEKVINKYKPRMVIALGDTNTVVATALTSSKLSIPFAHLEAGMRSWDKSMPEEINRVIADHIADVLFAFTRLAQIYLAHEGIPLDRTFVTGSTEVDVIYKYWDEINKKGKNLVEEYNLSSGEYVIVTVHRQANVDNPVVLTQILSALSEIAEKYQVKIVFPVHPRTRKAIATYGVEHMINSKNILLLSPLGFFEFLGLLKHAGIVLTDSGGVQVDACTLKIPTIVLRYNTEYPECVILGIAELAGTRKEDIVNTFEKIFKKEAKTLKYPNPLGDGKAGERIARILRGVKVSSESPDLRASPTILYNLDVKTIVGDEIIAWYDDQGFPLGSNHYYYLVRRKLGLDDFKYLRAFLKTLYTQ